MIWISLEIMWFFINSFGLVGKVSFGYVGLGVIMGLQVIRNWILLRGDSLRLC